MTLIMALTQHNALIMILGIMEHSIMTLSIMILSIMTLNKNDTQHKGHSSLQLCHNAECNYVASYFVVLPNASMLDVIMLNVVLP
jgi:hypothetical protein